jgi:phenylacetaldehyde dehydrogenase
VSSPPASGAVPGVHVGGTARPGGRFLRLIDPSTGRGERVLAAAAPEDVEEAVAAALAVHRQRRWAALPAPERARILREVATQLRAHAGEVAAELARESGLPVGAARYVEVPLAAEALDYFASLASTAPLGEVLPFAAPGCPATQLAFTLQQPRGVAALITPANFPLLIPAWKVGAVLAAGCPAVLKPAPSTPSPALRLARLLEEAGAPPGTLTVLCGDEAVGAALVAHPAVRTVSFTGSTGAGREVLALAARDLKPTILELGGKSPVVVCADADLDAAVQATLFGVFFHAGQVCQAGSRVLVAAQVYEVFCRRLAQRARGLAVGPASDPGSDLGPLATLRQWQRARTLVAEAVAAGADLLAGELDPPPPSGGFFFPPTVLRDVPVQAQVWREEVFGPVVCLRPFSSLDEAVALANDSPYGLVAAVWTRELRLALDLAQALEAGTVWINTAMLLSPCAPFGGCKHSGLGRELGRQALEAYRETKTVIIEQTSHPWTYF